ncbi:MAG TPA: Rap1a/Tai family immunity protein [Burkholderiaceae bacterium]|nr:Rap1a/Tai family immunity protein [Burkholderiaceae bacterium]
MNKKLLSALAIVVSLHSTVATAEITGNELHIWLGSKNSADSLRGYAYLEGVLDAEDFYLTNEIFVALLEKNPTANRFKVAHICFDDAKVTLGQIKDIVYKYLEDNPAKRHIRAHSLVRYALMETFACTKNPQSSPTK